jgi:hypothetical protein
MPIAGLLLIVLPPTAHAQLPFFTDDIETADRGKFHFEFFNEHDVLQRARYPAKRQNTATFTLDYGLTKRIELAFITPLVTIFNTKSSGLGDPTGIGDVRFGAKYRFRD